MKNDTEIKNVIYSYCLRLFMSSLCKEGIISRGKYNTFLLKEGDISINDIINIAKINAKQGEILKNKFYNSYLHLYISYIHHNKFKKNVLVNKKINGELLELYCWSGHNTYAFPKYISHIGNMDYASLIKNYKLKWLFFIFCPLDKIIFNSSKYLNYDEFLQCRCPYIYRKYLHLINRGFYPVPIHYLQLKHDVLIKKLLTKKSLYLVRRYSKNTKVLTSIRTMYLPEEQINLKLPVNINITSENRLIFQAQTHNAPLYSNIMKSIVDRENKLFLISEDVASVRFNDIKYCNHLSCIFRENINNKEKNIIPANFLFEFSDIKKNVRHLDNFFIHYKLSSDQVKIIFFKKYLKCLLKPSFLLFLKYGIGIEPHLQNVMFEFSDKFMPLRIYIRDLDGIKINFQILNNFYRKDLIGLHKFTKDYNKNDDFSLIRLFHSLVVNHIQEIINYYVLFYKFDKKELIKIANNCVEDSLNFVIKNNSQYIDKNRLAIFKKYWFSDKVKTKAVLKMIMTKKESFQYVMVNNYFTNISKI